ncbi:hypothetical protein L1987_79366 [Smallanthus sonchifolius]|uniref:Uncharacterized protein n=1 Tax=Smallanthus sonchifolius TaxID=185202 RepID=A0ACB8ZEA4_9ASTR|nr:hypothetical protein L1987_79366 [Smallanthus sonchifolius]
MGTEVHCKSSFEGYYSMGDVNEDSNSSNWPLFYGEKTLNNGHYYNGFIPRTITDANPGCDKDALKQQMVEHETVFKNQVYELHRLYRRQRDMMEEVKRNEYHKHRISIDTSSSSSLLPSQKPHEDGQKWQIPSFPLSNSCARPSIFGTDISNSPLSCSKGNNNNNNSSKDCEIMESRPSKVRKKLFDLELPPEDNIDNEHEEHEEIQCKQASEESSYKDTSLRQCYRGSSGLADLNEPINVKEPMAHGSVDGFGPSAKPKGSLFLGPNHDLFEKSQSGAFNPLLREGGNGRGWLSNTHETGNSRSNMNFTPGTYPEISTRVQDNSRFTPSPFPATSSSSPYMNPTGLGNSWGKSNGNLTHKLTSFQKQPSFLSSQQSHVVFGDKWRMNGCYTPNGFYHGSSSGSKDPYARLPSGGFDHRNYNNLDDRSQKIVKGSNFIDLTDTTKGIDLNNDINSSRKCDQAVLPWLQAKPNISKNEKIFGIPVFGNSCISRNESSSLVSTSASLRCPHENGKIKTEMKNRGFDMNIAWDDHANKQIDVEDCNLGKKPDTEIDKIKNHFDLNSCLTEDEDVFVPVKSSSEKVKKIAMEIDLEAPAVPEDEEEEAIDDEFIAKVAAEAIVTMTGISGQQDQAGSPSEEALRSDDNAHLLWFVEVVENAGFVERDEYEELTLQQELTKEEDYMPKTLAPDCQEPDEAGPSTGPTRLKRGQTRRGRPRRDFQRDILPGLVSLSRHEVTEDLQIFGGLMRATGHSWNVGLTRRNGTRGRRKTVVAAIEPTPSSATPPPPSHVVTPPPLLSEVVGLEERSLTGWGKTTRRPRRPRCAAGTSVAVPLT